MTNTSEGTVRLVAEAAIQASQRAGEGRAMTDRSKAGRKARMRGLSCERRCINYQREVLGRKVWRIRGSPTPDFVGWTEAGCWVIGEIKNRALGPTALKNVGERLLEQRTPPGTFLEVWMEQSDGSWARRFVDKIGTKFSHEVK